MPGWLWLAMIVIAFLFLVHPNFNRRKIRMWQGRQFAHRGLHDAAQGIIENTLPALERACEAGYGIELDIQLSKDLQVIVFHDDNLMRMCGDARKVSQLTLAELRTVKLPGTQARIPTLEEALECVKGRIPLLIELKSGLKNKQLCCALMEIMAGYHGEYMVESFNPLIVGWFRRNAPQVVRGQLVSPMREYIPLVDPISAFCMSGLLFNFIARPDFVAYDANAPRFFSPHFQRFMFRTPMAGWTIKTEKMATLIRRRREMCIFENIFPSRRK